MAVEVSESAQGESFLHFLYELRPGPTNESLGIYVAKLSWECQKDVVERAWSVLKKLEETEASRKQRKTNESSSTATSQASEINSLFLKFKNQAISRKNFIPS